MEELVIKNHDFEDAKLAIKNFSEQTTTDLDLKRVDDKKGFVEFIFGGGLGINHKVTGEELNELTVQIQSHLKNVNTIQIKLIKQFGQVYNALESLDKDYIQAILISIKATEETSKRIEATQEQIKKIVEDQKKTLEVLKKFKQNMDSYTHLKDVDTLWDETKKQSRQIEELQLQGAEAKRLMQHGKQIIEQSLAAEKESPNTISQQLYKKIQYAYLIAGCAIGLSLIELILLLLKVM